MTANASAIKLQTLIGLDLQDWSEARMGFDVGVDKRDRSGLFKVTGSLTLASIGNIPESLNPRINQARWCRGQRVIINVELSDGSFIRHRFGWLYILKEPSPPTPENPKLVLELGCRLSLKDYREPDEDQSGIDLGVSTTRTQAIASLLAAAGITEWVGDVPLYPIGYPLPKESGSYIGQAGEIAYAGFKALHQLNDGTITAVALGIPDLKVEPLLTATIGEDEVEYKPQIGAETPVEEMIAVGSSCDVIDTWGEISDCSFEFAPGSAKVIRKSCFYQKADETTELYRTTTFEAKGLVLPQDFHGVSTLVFSRSTTNEKFYDRATEDDANGKLIGEKSLTVRPFAAAILSLWNSFTPAQKANYTAFSPAQADLTVTDYIYECKDTLRDKRSFSKGLLGAILTDLDITVSSPTGIVPSGSTSETYREDRPNIWTYLRSSAEPLVQAFPDAIGDDDTIAEKIQLVTTSEPPSISPTQNQPPATERRPDRYQRIDKLVEGKAKFGTFAGAQEQERTRTIEVKYCSDISLLIPNDQRQCTQINESEQLNQIAKMEGQLLIGRRQGQRTKLPINDKWLTDTNPCAMIICREPTIVNNLIVYDEFTFMIDGLSFIHDRTKGLVAFDNIWTATKLHDAPTARLPFTEIFLDTIGDGEGFEDAMLPYALVAEPIFDYFGEGEGLEDFTSANTFDYFGEGEGLEDTTAVINFDGVGEGEGIVDTQLFIYDSIGEGEGFEDVVNASGYEDETTALLARFSSTYNTARKDAINALIKALKDGAGNPANATWDTLDALWIMAAPVTADALLNWKSTSFNMSAVSSPSFMADRGYTTDGSSSYLDTNFNPFTAAGNYTQNSATTGLYTRTPASDATGNLDFGAFDFTHITDITSRFNDVASLRINSGTGAEFQATNAGSGRAALSGCRTNSSTLALYGNGSALTRTDANTLTSTGLPNASYYLGGRNIGGLNAPIAREYAACWIGSGWTAGQNSAFYTALQTYLTVIGANV